MRSPVRTPFPLCSLEILFTFPLVSSIDEVLDVAERLAAFVDHQTDRVSQVLGVALLVPGLVDDVILSLDLKSIFVCVMYRYLQLLSSFWSLLDA